MTYHGHIRNGVAVLDEPAHLPDGTPVLIQAADAFGFLENLSIEALAARQQGRRVNSLDDLAGDWPPEDCIDDFIAMVREARR